MTIGLILKRMRREWRSLSILLLAVCLLTGFFALGPFYVRAVTDVGLRFDLDNASPRERLITLVVDNEPLTRESFNVVREELGDLAVGYQYFIRADYTPPTSEMSGGSRDLATRGYIFRYGEPVTSVSSRTDSVYQPYAFADMPSILDLVEGRWPVRLPTPDEVDPAGLSDEEQQERQIGIYNRGEVEVVVTRTVADEADLELGSRITLGTRMADGSGEVASIVVVGIVEPKDPNDLIWDGNRNFLEGSDVETTPGNFRYDFGMAAIPEAYTDWLRAVTPGNSYVYQFQTNTDVVSADNTRAVSDHLTVLQSRLSAYHPGLSVLSGLTNILDNFAGNVSETEGPIILLSGAILIMMLYHLINTVALVLEQQGSEWSTIVSRGGSVPQLVALQLVTVGVLGLAGMAAGPLLSVVFMRVMERFGPLSHALGGRSLDSTTIPTISIYMSIGAAVAAVIVLTSPALPAANRSLLRLKQMVSRPPTRPAWARFALDIILLGVGLGFMLRLYYLVGGKFGDLLNNLFAAPRDVIRLIADNLTETGGLNDPFNLLGPALVLTGAALLWLRFFPWLMDRFSRLFSRSRHLTTPLALWNVSRDPSHYAQLVLLLIGTLALGTASLGLSATRDRGAWAAAHDETGGSARIEIDPAALDAATVNWDRLPGVSSSAMVLHAEGDPGSSARTDVHIFGVTTDASDAFPDLSGAIDPLAAIPAPPDPGVALPDDASLLSVQVYSTAPQREDEPAVSVQLTAYLQDALGVPYAVPLALPGTGGPTSVAPDAQQQPEQSIVNAPTPTDEWLTFNGTMPAQGRLPYRLMRIGINDRQGNLDAFEHTIYIDRIATQDAFGTAETVESFEDETNAWAEATTANPYAASWAATADTVSRVQGVVPQRVTDEVPPVEGDAVLRLDYRTGRMGGVQREPSIVVNEPQIRRIPVVINARFASLFAGTSSRQTAADEPLTVGEEKNLVLNLGTGSVEIGFVVAGVVDDIPSVPEDEPALLAPLALIQPVLNQAAASNAFFARNEIWLELPDREPSGALEDAIAALPGIDSTAWAWTRYGEIQREPLPSAVAGMLFAGFWISLALSLLDFGFYLMVTARQRSFTFGVLRSLGWNASNIWRLLLIEQIVLILPALLIGSLIGLGLAYLLLPFLALVGGETLSIPWLSLLGMLLALIASYSVLMGITAIYLRRMSVNQVLRLEGE
ncbi:ABC transporter permease [Aggregatilinea lenta]|uniref:ABC transporter permease n=1 Tax=Aggregatilinea lenta TaxID=913108 RepID=UPI000E5AA218|nr:ABC transporter permease [Aggregatilinea lenta]